MKEIHGEGLMDRISTRGRGRGEETKSKSIKVSTRESSERKGKRYRVSERH